MDRQHPPHRVLLSVIIPTLNAARHLPAVLASIAQSDNGAVSIEEIIVSDAGSQDNTAPLAAAAGAIVLTGPCGRGHQLAAGAERARAPWLLFLHADTILEPAWAEALQTFVKEKGIMQAAAFRFQLDDPRWRGRILEAMVALRCALLRLPYGDQGLLISRDLYDALGGYRSIPLMEDVDFVRRIGRARLTMLGATALTSADRYRKSGYMRRVMRNILCLTAYFAGVSPARLRQFYDATGETS